MKIKRPVDMLLDIGRLLQRSKVFFPQLSPQEKYLFNHELLCRKETAEIKQMEI